MLFHSATFLFCVTGLVALYWVTPWQRARLVMLFLSSLLFYGWRHWPSVFLLLGSIAFNYTMGRQLESRRSKALLALGITVNLSFLTYFKYGRFLVDQLINLGALLGLELTVPKPDAWMPLGISFFTFQVIAYLVDVYRKELPAERSLLVFAVFKSFFAQLVAGPICRGKELLPQLREKVPFDITRIHRGAWLVLCGLFLKVGVADVLGDYVDFAWKFPETLGINNAWLTVYAYAVQLLADFWGYSTMAVGLGLCFGLALPVNFDHPYGASSLREFWTRWHITLSVWLRDYLYISLGGNRVSKARAALNRLITMGLGGLWHGAGWNFLLWGVLHAACWSRLKNPPADDRRRNAKSRAEKASRAGSPPFRPPRPPPAARDPDQLVVLADRDGDRCELVDVAQHAPPNLQFLLRAQHDRNLERQQHLWAFLAQQPATTRTIAGTRRRGQTARTATVVVRWSQITITAPTVGCKKGSPPVTRWAGHAHEPHPPAGVEAIDWLLLSNRPITTVGAAWERVPWSRCGWGIEAWHRLLTTSCHAEAREFKTAAQLQCPLTCDLIIAWPRTGLPQTRPHPAGPARQHPLPARRTRGPVRPSRKRSPAEPPTVPPAPLTLGQVNRRVAMLGGYFGRATDGPPGAETLTADRRQLMALTAGWHLRAAAD